MERYRFYSPQQLIAVHFVTFLTAIQLSHQQIKHIESERSPKSIIDLLENQKRALHQQISRLTEIYSAFDLRSDLMREGLNTDLSRISLNEVKGGYILMGDPNVWNPEETFHDPFIRFCSRLENTDAMNPCYPVGAYHNDWGCFEQSPDRPDRFFSLNPKGTYYSAAGRYVVGYTRGNYGILDDVCDRIRGYIQENSLVLDGPVFVVYLFDEICINNPDEYLAKVYVAVKQ